MTSNLKLLLLFYYFDMKRVFTIARYVNISGSQSKHDMYSCGEPHVVIFPIMVTSVWIIQQQKKPIHTKTYLLCLLKVLQSRVSLRLYTHKATWTKWRTLNEWLTSFEVMHKNKKKREINLQAL